MSEIPNGLASLTKYSKLPVDRIEYHAEADETIPYSCPVPLSHILYIFSCCFNPLLKPKQLNVIHTQPSRHRLTKHILPHACV